MRPGSSSAGPTKPCERRRSSGSHRSMAIDSRFAITSGGVGGGCASRLRERSIADARRGAKLGQRPSSKKHSAGRPDCEAEVARLQQEAGSPSGEAPFGRARRLQRAQQQLASELASTRQHVEGAALVGQLACHRTSAGIAPRRQTRDRQGRIARRKVVLGRRLSHRRVGHGSQILS